MVGLFGKLFGGSGGDGDDAPSLVDAWQMIGHRLGLAVQVRGEHSIEATGSVRGRGVAVSIEGRQVGTELLRGFATTNRKRVHQRWNTQVAVACHNPRRIVGTVEMFTDANDPAWNPRVFDPAQCRAVRATTPGLADLTLSPSLRARLAPVLFDPRFDISADAVRLVTDEKKVDVDGGYFVGSPIHVNYPNAPQPWPERAVAGPVWWIEMMCEIADAVDALHA